MSGKCDEILVEYKKMDSSKVPQTFTLEKVVMEKIKTLATRHKLSLSEVVNELLKTVLFE